MSKTAHTPEFIYGPYLEKIFYWDDGTPSRYQITPKQMQFMLNAHAEYVLACNAHDDLVSALEMAREQIAFAAKPKLILDEPTALKRIDAALAKAKGE